MENTVKNKIIRYVVFFFLFFVGLYFFVEEKDFLKTIQLSVILLIVITLSEILFPDKKR